MSRNPRIVLQLVVNLLSAGLVMAADTQVAPCGANGAASVCTAVPATPPAYSCDGDTTVVPPPYIFVPPNPQVPELNISFGFGGLALALLNRLQGIEPQAKKQRPHAVGIAWNLDGPDGETKTGRFTDQTCEAIVYAPRLGFNDIRPGWWTGDVWLSFDGRRILAGRLEPVLIGPGSGDNERIVILELYRNPRKR